MPFFGVVTIEPFEVGRWRGGCGPVYGISMCVCGDSGCFCGRSGGDRRLATGRDEEEQCRIETRFTTEDCSAAPPSNDGDAGLAWVGNLDMQPADFGLTSVWETSGWFERYSSQRSPDRQHLCPGSQLSVVPYRAVSRNQQRIVSQPLTLKSLVSPAI